MNGAKYKPVTAELKWWSQWISTCPVLQSHHNQHQSDLKNIKVKETLQRLNSVYLSYKENPKTNRDLVYARFLAPSKSYMFSRARHGLHAFPRLQGPVVFPRYAPTA